MKHWKFKEMTGGKLKRLADQVQTVKGNNEAIYKYSYCIYPVVIFILVSLT